MRRALFTLACCTLVFTLAATAQSKKTGLWETTSSMEFQQSPFPQMPAQAANHGAMPGNPFAGPHTSQICVTQAQIDKYNSIFSTNNPQQRDCQISNIMKTPNGMTADMVCTGRTNGKGTAKFSWTDPEHSTGTIHFTGTMSFGPNTKPVEWTSTINSTFKGADCGSVKPADQ